MYFTRVVVDPYPLSEHQLRQVVANENAAHEAGESAIREAQENAEQVPTVPLPRCRDSARSYGSGLGPAPRWPHCATLASTLRHVGCASSET
jgi:hypothetical protein